MFNSHGTERHFKIGTDVLELVTEYIYIRADGDSRNNKDNTNEVDAFWQAHIVD